MNSIPTAHLSDAEVKREIRALAVLPFRTAEEDERLAKLKFSLKARNWGRSLLAK